ncbi:MAG: hypothetical protein K6G08_05800 [Prevotella sp.]|nr:hypothetical protein [Prevotella sp.]
MNNNFFTIGDLTLCISFVDSDKNSMDLLPSFAPFRTDEEQARAGDLLLTMTVDDTLRPAKDKKLVRKFDTGNGDTLVYLLSDGGYQYIIRDIYGRDCCLLICLNQFSNCQCALNGDAIMRSFGLNDAMMLAFAFAGSYRQTLLVHASTIMLGEWGYPFTAKSGTGKSTHTSLWMKCIEGAELMNDDNPIIRILDDGQPYIFGSPWSGKTPCYRNVKARLGAVTRIERALQNSIEKLPPVQAFASLLPACSSMKWDSAVYNNLCDAVTKVIETTPIFTMHCLPDEDAARVCHNAIAR